MNKTTVFLVIGVLLTVFSISIAQRNTEADTMSNTSLDNPNAVIDFSDKTNGTSDDDDNNDDDGFGGNSINSLNSLNSVGVNSGLPSSGRFTTGNSPSTGEGALKNSMGTQTFNSISNTNSTSDTTGPARPSSTGNDGNASPTAPKPGGPAAGGGNSNVESPTGSTSGSPVVK